MVTNVLINIFFAFAGFLISLLPSPPVQVTVSFFDVIGKGIYVFGSGLWAFTISNIVFWSMLHSGWMVIEWLYKKIPGVS